MMVRVLLALLILTASLLLLATTTSMAMASRAMAKSGCRETCGDVSIPYPFGIGDGCYLSQEFNLTCDARNVTFLHSSTSSIKVFGINLARAQVRAGTLPASKCIFSNGSTWGGDFARGIGDPFRVSSKANKLTVTGCNTLAFFIGYNAHTGGGGSVGRTGCFSVCTDGDRSFDDGGGGGGGQCSGVGCCETSIASGLTYSSINLTFDDRFDNTQVSDFNPCSLAFVAEEGWFRFHPSDLNGTTVRDRMFNTLIPFVLGWVIAGSKSCDEAAKDAPSYACVSANSQCIDSTESTGYFCRCSDGFEGNPYLQDGCQDIDECQAPDKYRCYGICGNKNGTYNCDCPPGTQSSDPKGEACKPNPASQRAQSIGLTVGIGVCGVVGVLFMVFGVVFLSCKIKHQRERKLKQQFFKQNRGHLLQELVSQSANIAERMIIPLEELEKATNNFDKAREVGKGGHATVYKGILSDLRVVAIKKSKRTIQREINEFIKEVAILSQINHRNVVKLFGCCLETEVPLLVYEFISNGTLYHHLHVEGPTSLSWLDRLRIATEASRGIAYLHSAASPPIIHRDIKSHNILLDGTLATKISDFGASRCISVNQTGVTTVIQGTWGYIDPMCHRTGRITEKSDVYSFGVVLIELLTKKHPYSYRSIEDDSLVEHFSALLAEGNLVHILDPQVGEEGGREVIKKVAVLALACVKLKSEDRPTMRQVEMTLENCLLASQEQLVLQNTLGNRPLKHVTNLMDEGSIRSVEASRRYSLEEEFLLSGGFPR